MASAVSKPVELVFIRDNTRRYVIWEGEIDGQHIVIHGFGALFPERYLPSRSAESTIWHCPVRTCGQALATPPDLGDHFLKFHAGAILHDHLDGTFSVLPQDPESAYDANRQPYVASQGRMLQSPSLRQPSQSVPLQPGPGALDTPAVPVGNHDMSNPQTGNKPPASSSEVDSDDESDGSSDNDSDGSDTNESDGDDADEGDGSGADESDEDDADGSDGSDDNESDGSDANESDEDDDNDSDRSDDALPMESQDSSQKKRKANNDDIAPEPKKAKATSAPLQQDPRDKQLHNLPESRISYSNNQPAFWEREWGHLPFAENEPSDARPGLAYSSSYLAEKRVVDDDTTTFQIVKVPHKPRRYYQAGKQPFLFAVKEGVVRVWVSGEEPFTIYPGGCWNLKPGQHCTMGSHLPGKEVEIFIMGRILARGWSTR